MSWPGRFFANDEELGKKNDDHRPNGRVPTPSAPWSVRQQGPAVRKRRVIYVICGILLLYLFVKNIPTDVGPHPRWADTRVYRDPEAERNGIPKSATPPTGKPPRPAQPSEAEEHYHDGPIKFYKLASSLHAAARLGGQRESNKNVLFAAASLKSLSEILPLACDMASWDRNDVHMAIMGRDDMEIGEIQKINGALEEDCDIHWHDARPDIAKWSSRFRMEASVTASLEHIQTFIHPQVVIIDDSEREEDYFSDSILSKARELSKPVIQLPPDAMGALLWMTRLDSASLAAWPTTYVDILIQAPSGSSGTIVRLLRSIESADYFGSRRPHLTVELPSEIDPPTWGYLENLVWPPMDETGATHVSQVTLRHRIPRQTMTEEEASARLVESFYPRRIMDSHVLVLSPQVELSPLYYHYLLYSILEYKYSRHVKATKEAGNVIGISLDLPTSYLNDTTTFKPPLKPRSKQAAPVSEDESPPFLWQSPNNNAALYFGDKWAEFHSFLSARLTKAPSDTPKVISKKHPAWLEYFLELMRARGYSLIYPGVINEHFSLATVHNELYQVPEEFSKKQSRSNEADVLPISPEQALEANATARARKPPPNKEHALLESTITSLLPNKGDLLEITNMPLLSYDGSEINFKASEDHSFFFTHHFQHSTGGCQKDQKPYQKIPFKAIDLFCNLGDPYDFYAATKPQRREESYVPDELAKRKDPDMIEETQIENAKSEAQSHFGRQHSQTGGGGAKPTKEEKSKFSKGSKDPKKPSEKKGDSKSNGKTPEAESTKEKPKGTDKTKSATVESQSEATTEVKSVSDEAPPKASETAASKKELPKAFDGKDASEDEMKSPGW